MTQRNTTEHGLLLLLGVLVSMLFLHSPGTIDVQNAWVKWLNNAVNHGIVEGFHINDSLYPPLCMTLMGLAAKTAHAAGIDLFLGLKISLLLFLCVTSGLFYWWTRDVLLTALFHVALLLNSVALVYLDIYFGPTLLLAFWALHRKRHVLFGVFFTLAVLTKYQPIILAPFLGLYVLDISRFRDIDRKRLIQLVKEFWPAAAIVAATVALFGSHVALTFYRTLDYHRTTGMVDNAFISGNALNVNWVVTHILHAVNPARFGALDGGQANFIFDMDPRLHTAQKIAFAILFTALVWRFFRAEKTYESVLIHSMAGYLAYFMVYTGVHENHLFIIPFVTGILAWLDPRHRNLNALWTAVTLINLYLFYGTSGEWPGFSRVIAGVDTALLFSLFNIALCIHFYFTQVRPIPKTSA